MASSSGLVTDHGTRASPSCKQRRFLHIVGQLKIKRVYMSRKNRQGNILQNDIETLNAQSFQVTARSQKEDRDDVDGYRIWHAKIAVHACVSAHREHDKRRRKRKKRLGYFRDTGV
ncbi:FCH domain only [Branchiostoma belcheri]|nr:FCH domain only [Branchiostoma belcheri]